MNYKYDIDRDVNPAWEATDAYLSSLFVPEDPALEAALQSHKSEDIPAINVSPLQGVLLHQLATMQSYGGTRPVNILEIGTLAGYSTIWLARAAKASGGRVTTLEFSQKHADVAKKNLERAGVLDAVDIIVGDARKTLPDLVGKGLKFEFIFIDADKPAMPDYWKYAMQLSKKGTTIVGDNVVRQGGIADPSNKDERVVGVRSYLEVVSKEPNVLTTCIQSVNGKGWDGYAISILQ